MGRCWRGRWGRCWGGRVTGIIGVGEGLRGSRIWRLGGGLGRGRGVRRLVGRDEGGIGGAGGPA